MNIDPQKVSWVVFDIDGVLIDVSKSFYMAFHELVKLYCNRLNLDYLQQEVEELIPSVKLNPQMNDDWDAGEAVNLIYLNRRLMWFDENKIWDMLKSGNSWAEIRNSFNEAPLDFELMQYELMSIYGGDKCEELFGFPPANPNFSGTYRNEKELVSANLIRELPVHKIIYTGRNRTETEIALQILGLDLDEFALLLYTDSGYLKPDATPLINWYNKYIEDGEIGLFFGDTGADLATVEKFSDVKGNGKLLFIAIGDILKRKGLPYQFDSVEEAIETIFRK